MKRRAVLLLLGLLACSSPPPPRRQAVPPGNPAIEKRRIEEALADYVAAENSGEVGDVLACFTENAWFFPPGEDPIQGAAQIGERYLAFLSTGRTAVRMQRRELTHTGALAVVHGRLTGSHQPSAGGRRQVFEDDFLMALERRSPGWRISHLMWNPAPR